MNLRKMQCAAVLLIIGGLTGCQTLGSKFTARTYNMGDRMEISPFIATVYETQWLTQLGTGLEAKIPNNRFMLVRLTVTNGGSSEAVLPPLVLVDDKDQTYSELPSAEGFPNWLGLVRNIRPADTLSGNAVFDVPPQHYKLKIMDDTEKPLAYVELPLSFNSEAPDLVPNANQMPALPPPTKQQR